MERQHCHHYLKAEEGCNLPHRSITDLRSSKSYRAVMLPNLKVFVCFFLLGVGGCGVWGFWVGGSMLFKGPESYK